MIRSLADIIGRKFSLLIAIFFSLQIIACNEASIDVSLISQAELIRQIETEQSFLILDVRSKKEYEIGHIPGAINIDFKELNNRIEEINSFRNSQVVVYCERGIRAKVAEATLQQAGFQSIFHLEGDMSAWRKNFLPMESQ
ncbi:MAG: rhodanese-like domain-containing protein [Cyanobacteria bacterium P01_F01_bin.143]